MQVNRTANLHSQIIGEQKKLKIRVMKWLYLLAIPALLGGSYVAAQSYYGGRILPNVLVAGVNLGGMTVQDAKTALEAVKTSTPTVTVKVGKREYVLPASDLGWTPDVDASAQAALEQGKDATVFNHLSGGEAKTLPIQGVVNQDVLKAKLRELALDQDRMPVRAKAVFVGAKYEIRNDVKGVRANVGAAMTAFTANPTAQTLEMPLETVSALVTRETLAPRVTEANALIRPLKVIYPVKGGVKSVLIKPLSVADLFWLRDTLEPDKATLEAKLKQVGFQLDRPARNASYVFSSGKLARVKEQIGTKIDLIKSLPLFTAAVMDPKVSQVEILTTVDTPKLTLEQLPDPSKLQILSASTSFFKGSSAERSANVYAAATHLDGHVIAPDEVFSFLDTIGSIDVSNGYKTALVISGGRTVEGVGGGVCQVSTTTFRALYSAGLPVVERNQHAYRVHWYEPFVGFEAAVYQPGVDLKMKNDTGAPLLIRAMPNLRRGTLTVQLWGIPDGRRVVVSPARILSQTPHPPAQTIFDASIPTGQTKQVDWAVDGFHIQIYRTVRGGAVGKTTDLLETVYKPWRAVFAVGKG